MTWLKADPTDRPYPEGRAWDEAWRERRRADRLAGVVAEARDFIMSGPIPGDETWLVNKMSNALENQYDY